MTLDKKNSKLNLYNSYVLVVAFFLVRILTIAPIWYIFYTLIGSPEWNSIEVKYKFVCVVTSLPLDILNLTWFSKIIQIALKYRKAANKEMPVLPEEFKQSMHDHRAVKNGHVCKEE